jgi:hypothetical protein
MSVSGGGAAVAGGLEALFGVSHRGEAPSDGHLLGSCPRGEMIG